MSLREYKGGVVDRFSHTEGSVVRNENGVFEHQYTIRDHLGNTRVTYRDGINKVDNTGNTSYNDGIITVSDMMQINHFYPFGMNMEGNWNGSYPDAKNKYQYNGKELNSDFGLEWNDYGARFYDPSISRWLSVDPLAEKMRRHSPYNYAFDNPMRFIDPDGMAPEDQQDPGDKYRSKRTKQARKERQKEQKAMDKWMKSKGYDNNSNVGSDAYLQSKNNNKNSNTKSESFGDDAKRVSSTTGIKFDTGNKTQDSPVEQTSTPTGTLAPNGSQVATIGVPFEGASANPLDNTALTRDASALANTLNQPENATVTVTIVGLVSGNTNINPDTGENFASARASLIQSKLIERGVDPSRITVMAGTPPATPPPASAVYILNNQNIQMIFKRE